MVKSTTFSVIFDIIGKKLWRLRMKGKKVLKAKLNAKGMQISVVSDGSYDDYITLTDIAKYKSEIRLPQSKTAKLRYY